MKKISNKINKTLLLASTLFVSTAVSTADKSYADEGYDLNVEPSKSTDLDNYETEANVENSEATSDDTINYDNQALTNDESIDQSQSLTPQENTTDQQSTDSTQKVEADFEVELNPKKEEKVEDLRVVISEAINYKLSDTDVTIEFLPAEKNLEIKVLGKDKTLDERALKMRDLILKELADEVNISDGEIKIIQRAK